MSVGRREPVPTIFGVPLKVVLGDPRFLDLMRTIMRERGGDPETWTALTRVAIEELRQRQERRRNQRERDAFGAGPQR